MKPSGSRRNSSSEPSSGSPLGPGGSGGVISSGPIMSLAAARARHDAMAALLRELVEIESPSSSAAGVAALAERLAPELEALGLRAELLPVDGAGPMLRARSGEGRAVMLLGHLDTVWPLGTLRARPVRIEG